MTAAASCADDAGLRIFRNTMAAYLAEHRGHEHASALSRNAQQAGLDAVRDELARHPAETELDLTGYRVTTSLAEKDRLKAIGWTCVGASHLYVLAPPEHSEGLQETGT
jgi:hypothetical protein